MAKNLVIVESPAKAKTIEGYLGKDFLVKSSYGHVRDLPKEKVSIDVENGFEPTYEITDDKKEVVRELKKLSKEAEVVWLATDDDREGEAISWHLYHALDLSKKETNRIAFHEITKKAIQAAIATPRTIDYDLVNAQQARRILDRLVGYELSPVLWKKIKRGLSAGRVQSVAVRLVVEREREVDLFNSSYFYKVVAIFKTEKGKEFKAELPEKYKTEEEAQQFLTNCIAKDFHVKDLEKKPGSKKPSAPFTTSTLQQEAARKLGFSVSQTMTVAQRLYESGKITYMRTDSVNLSEDALQAAQDQITKEYGAEYAERRQYKTKSASAQEAHEAIRPTNFAEHTVDGERNEQRLYELIWKRAIASQMANAKTEKTNVEISISKLNEVFKASGEVITFEGFLKVYLESNDDDDDDEEGGNGVLPAMVVGEKLDPKNIVATQRFTRPPARYNEAMLVKKLEEMGIGRPSTYAPTISTVQKRGYVIKEVREGTSRNFTVLSLEKTSITKEIKKEITGAEKGKLYPTDIAMVVTDFLVKNFPTVTGYTFTATIEQQLDEIANGKIEWKKMMEDFYSNFHERVVKTEEIDRSEVDSSRILGKDPVTGHTVLVRLGKFGALAQIGTAEELGEEKPRFASLKKGQLIGSITFDEAMELFKLPREVGYFEDKKVTASIGRFGPYVVHNSMFVSLKEDDPLSIDLDRAIELILAKREADANKIIKTFDEDPNVQILNGRWGPYIKFGKENVKIPKDITDHASLTYAKCVELAENAPAPKGRFAKKAAPAAKEVKPAKEKKVAAKKAPAKKATAAKASPEKATKTTTKKKS